MSPQIALSHAILLIPLFMTGNVVGYSKTKWGKFLVLWLTLQLLCLQPTNGHQKKTGTQGSFGQEPAYLYLLKKWGRKFTIPLKTSRAIHMLCPGCFWGQFVPRSGLGASAKAEGKDSSSLSSGAKVESWRGNVQVASEFAHTFSNTGEPSYWVGLWPFREIWPPCFQSEASA
jgi:hypothetical protein